MGHRDWIGPAAMNERQDNVVTLPVLHVRKGDMRFTAFRNEISADQVSDMLDKACAGSRAQVPPPEACQGLAEVLSGIRRGPPDIVYLAPDDKTRQQLRDMIEALGPLQRQLE